MAKATSNRWTRTIKIVGAPHMAPEDLDSGDPMILFGDLLNQGAVLTDVITNKAIARHRKTNPSDTPANA